MLQKWLRDKLQGYIIDIANRVLPQRMHELEVQHCLYAKKVIVKILRKNILGLCYPGYRHYKIFCVNGKYGIQV